jgi:hypothetical protein
MFEDYLEDAYFFASHAKTFSVDREAQRYYRASVFYAMSALEAFLNYLADAFDLGKTLEEYEIAFLKDKRFGLKQGVFAILGSSEYHSIEDKLRILLRRFAPDFNLERNPAWSHFMEFKDLRNAITHPRKDEDDLRPSQYEKKVSRGLTAVLELMNTLCKGIFKKPLRKGLLDLVL